MRMRNLEQKRELIIKKKKMRERGIKIDDMTWKEMEVRGNNKTEEGEGKESMNGIREDTDRGEMVEMVEARGDTEER